MKRIAAKATMAALLSAIVSVALGSIVFPGPYGLPDGAALFMCVLCPLVIAWPASGYMFWHRERLRSALEEVERAHEELSHTHRALAEKARLDPMTSMLNRETFFSMVEEARKTSDSGTLLIIDADNFKKINDTHGHLTGDGALLEISAAVQRAVRENDIVGRIGGEEFGAFLVDSDHRSAMHIAERIRSEVAEISFAPLSTRIPLSVSVGGAMHSRAFGLTDLLREADRRLYEAKGRGRNRVVFTAAPVAA